MANKKIAIANNFKSSFIFLLSGRPSVIRARGRPGYSFNWVPTRAARVYKLSS